MTVIAPPPDARSRRGMTRHALPGARRDRLFYAQVHEDPLLELETLRPTADDTMVVVSSGGCTALSLLAAGAGTVRAVDLNAVQNDLVELKYQAVRRLTVPETLAFLGAVSATGRRRRAWYAHLREFLTPGAAAYWDARPRAITRGVLGSGVSERFQSLLAALVRTLIHPPSRIRRLLECRSLEEQRALYAREWNSRRWRLLYRLLLSRAVFNRTYDPAFFAHVENPSFSRHFHALAERTLTELPVADNYFLHYVLTGRYPSGVTGGVPPYLSRGGAATLRTHDGLTLVDGPMTAYLTTLPDGSVQGFSLSNIAEWLAPEGVDALFAEVARTAAPGARVCFRNFVGWTEVPARWRATIVEDRARGESLLPRDRSMVNRRFAVCRVVKGDR